MDYISISLKGKDKNYTQKFVPNDMRDVTMSHECDKLRVMVAQAEAHLQEKPEKVTIRAVMVW